MSALPVELHDSADAWALLGAVSAALADSPRKVEMIEGVITITPPPSNEHEEIIDFVTWQIHRHDDERGFKVRNGGTGLRIDLGAGVKPDIIVASKAAFNEPGVEYNPVEGQPIHLVVEVTSESTRRRDLTEKKRAYEKARIPAYLIVDRKDQRCYLFLLQDGTYPDFPVRSAPFGERLQLPDPLSFELDTSEFE